MLRCPFCGLATALPHETQAACIDALHIEISRVREVIGRMKEHATPPKRAARPVSGSTPTTSHHDIRA